MQTPETDVLGKIVAATRKRVKALKAERPVASLQSGGFWNRRPGDFRSAFLAPGPRVIAEIKFASPSKGRIAKLEPSEDSAAKVAADYLAGGAAALSILTEPEFFQGRPEFISRVRKENPKVMILMKDFVLEAYQLELARWVGADCVLLIAAALGKRLRTLLDATSALGLSALVEVHTEAELDQARRSGASLVGVNSRDLRTLKTDLSIPKALAATREMRMTAKGRVSTGEEPLLIAESGIKTRADMDGLAAAGYRGFLVGTQLMEAASPGKALKELLS